MKIFIIVLILGLIALGGLAAHMLVIADTAGEVAFWSILLIANLWSCAAAGKVAADVFSARYESAHLASESARTTETEALNALNRAQKEFDEAVAAIKEAAPTKSDWGSRNAQT